MMYLNFYSLMVLCFSMSYIFGFSEDFDLDSNKGLYSKRKGFPFVEEGANYQDDYLQVGKVNQSCQSIESTSKTTTKVRPNYDKGGQKKFLKS